MKYRKNSDIDDIIVQVNFSKAISPYSGQPLTRQILMHLLSEYQRPYDKVNELMKKGLLTPIKRGIFIPGPHVNRHGYLSYKSHTLDLYGA